VLSRYPLLAGWDGRRSRKLIQAAQKAQSSGTAPTAKEDLVEVQKGLQDETQKRREAEMAVAAKESRGD